MSDPLAAVINWVMKLVEGDENESWLFGLSPGEIITYSIFLLLSVAYVLSYIFRDFFQEIPLIEMVEDVTIPGGTNGKDDCEQLVNAQNPSEPREEYCETLGELVGNGGVESHGPCSPCLADPDNLPSCSPCLADPDNLPPCSPCLADPDNLPPCSPCLADPDNLPGDSSVDNTWEAHGCRCPCLADPDNMSGASSDESYSGEA